MFWIVVTILAVLFVAGGVVACFVGEWLGGIATVAVTLIVWGFVTFLAATDTVENGHIGIVREFGAVVGTTSDGFVTHAPWQSVDAVSVRNEVRNYVMDDRKEEGSGSAVSSDSQAVFLVVQVNYSLVRAGAVALYKETGGDYVNRILDPAVFQITKGVTARYKAIDFAANREAIRTEIEEQLQREVGAGALQIKNVSLKNVDFTDALSTAIEQTVEAEQQAKREEAKVRITEAQAKQAIATAEGEAKSNVARAEGEATANRLRERTLTPLLLQQQAIEKLNPKVQIIVCPPRTVCIPNSTPANPGG